MKEQAAKQTAPLKSTAPHVVCVCFIFVFKQQILNGP